MRNDQTSLHICVFGKYLEEMPFTLRSKSKEELVNIRGKHMGHLGG